MGETDANGAGIELPLRERLPEYVAVFVVGIAVAGAGGLLVGALSRVAMAAAVGYSIMILGVAVLFAGGVTGGGYSGLRMEYVARRMVLHGMGREPGRPAREYPAGLDPVEQIRGSMRPKANPAAFWQVIGGVLYIAVGLAVVVFA